MTGIQHVALHVADVPKSVHFYSNVLGWKEIPRPEFDFPGAWFRIGETSELHLIGGRTQATLSGPRSNHFALYCSDLEAMLKRIIEAGVPYEGIKTRPDGVRQLFVFDPDNHCIEFNNSI